MRVGDKSYRTIWLADDGWAVNIIDQTALPHEFAVARLETVADAAQAIRSMQVRGAPLIGATTAYGVCLALRADGRDEALDEACRQLLETRPTAVNLRWALNQMRASLTDTTGEGRVALAYARAAAICDEDVATCRSIGTHGAELIREAHAAAPDRPVNVLTHCNAGWLAAVDWGTALAPIYAAHEQGISLHVFVDETRPRNQGASLTAWELGGHGVPHTVIVDNAGGHLMQHGMVDMCLVGTDRTTAHGDVCNKIGTYLKALAARDTRVPFYVALPSSTIDWKIGDGIGSVPIEQRDPREVTEISGRDDRGAVTTVALTPPNSQAANYAFDVTPSRLVTALITERGVCPASREGLLGLYPEHAADAA